MKTNAPLLLASLAAAAVAQNIACNKTYPLPETCTGDCFSHDPSIALLDGTYYSFNTLDLLSIRTAPTLNGPWERAGSVLQNRSVIDMTGNDVLWAPDVLNIRGTWYCLYAVSVSGSQNSAIGYATSASLAAGSWTDRGQIVRSVDGDAYNCIDANFVRDGDKTLINWGSYWTDIYQAAAYVGDEHVYVSGNHSQIAYNTQDKGLYLEGSFTWRHDDYFYLFLSVGHCCEYDPLPAPGTEYHVNVCRSASATGPYVDRCGKPCNEGGGTQVLASHGDIYAPGGQGIFTDPVHGDVMYYHYHNRSVGVGYLDAKFGWNKMIWVDGWPELVAVS